MFSIELHNPTRPQYLLDVCSKKIKVTLKIMNIQKNYDVIECM